MNSVIFSHTTVMLNQAVDALNIDSDGIYIDGTYGRGGHSNLILSRLSNKGRLIVFDRDLQAIAHAKSLNDPRITVIHAPFSSMEEYITEMNLLGQVSGILLDLGISSPQIDDGSRGFSFNKNGPLDMRMDQSSGLSAREFLYQIGEKELSDILWKYGEEKNSRKIAHAIVNLQKEVSYEDFLPTTNDLVELIRKSSRFIDKNKNPATRSFQAIRIAVNNELGELETVLNSSLKILKTNGIISIISFHSLEDRIVKQFFKHNNEGESIPKNLPITDDMWESKIYYNKISKAIKPSPEEIENNVRSRSAILRWAQRSNIKLN